MKRILIIGPSGSGKLSLLEQLAGSVPPIHGSHGEVIHPMRIETKYFSHTVDIWIDEYDEIDDFITQWTSTEAGEVRAYIGILILCSPADSSNLKPFIESFTQKPVLVKLSPIGSEEDGWEVIDLDNHGRNEYGEYVDIRRLREIIETYDWTIPPDDTTDAPLDDLDGIDGVEMIEQVLAHRDRIRDLPDSLKVSEAEALINAIMNQ